MHLWSIVFSAVLAHQAVAQPVVMEERIGDELFDGRHMPKQHKRQIPYGGIISFGNSQANIEALQPKAKPCPEKAEKSGKVRGPLLGLIDVDLGVHLK